MNTREQYHPDKVWTWSKEEQAAYQDKIQPLLNAAAEAEELFSLDELEEYAKEYNAMTPDDDPGEEHESMGLDTHTDHEKHLYTLLRIDRELLAKMTNEGLQADIAQAALVMSHAQQEQVRPYAGEANGTDRYAIEGIAIYENFTYAQVQYIQAQQELVRRYRDQ